MDLVFYIITASFLVYLDQSFAREGDVRCGASLQNTEGNLESPNFPFHYPNNIECVWSITVPSKFAEVQLHFKKFNVENPRWAKFCFRDYVDVFQYVDGHRELAGRYCGKRGAFNVTATSNRIDVRFKTNRFKSRKGFSLTWTASKGCGGMQHGDHGLIKSKDFSTAGPTFCKWMIKVPPSYGSIEIKIKKIKLVKYIRDCRKQYLSIKDANKVELARYCEKTQPTTLVINGNEATITAKCKDGSHFKFEAEWQAYRQKIDKTTCGVAHVQKNSRRKRRLVGGSKVLDGSWPWMARVRTLLVRGRFRFHQVICGGALISSRFVITAAHCVDFNDHIFRQDVMLGATSIYDTSVSYINIRRIVTYPDYEGGVKHDLALIELDREVNLNYKIKPVCLPSLHHPVQPLEYWQKRSCWLSGWGRVGANGPSSEYLQMIDVMIWTDCLRSPMNFCGLYGSAQQGTCKGDSGSPLICLDETDNRFYIAGILTHGPTQCGSRYDAYVNAGYYSSWIQGVMSNFTQVGSLNSNDINY